MPFSFIIFNDRVLEELKVTSSDHQIHLLLILHWMLKMLANNIHAVVKDIALNVLWHYGAFVE